MTLDGFEINPHAAYAFETIIERMRSMRMCIDSRYEGLGENGFYVYGEGLPHWAAEIRDLVEMAEPKWWVFTDRGWKIFTAWRALNMLAEQ